MQIIVIIALWALIISPSYAQNFPSGSDNVEINLDALDPMEDSYKPPPMFDAPLTGLDVEKEKLPAIEQRSQSDSKRTEDRATKYFDPPPIPRKRPQVFKASPDFIQTLHSQNQVRANEKRENQIKEITTPQPISSEVNNDMNADMLNIDAQEVLDHISNDLTETPFQSDMNVQEREPDETEKDVLPQNNIISIAFSITSIEIPENGKDILLSAIVPSMLRNQDLRLEIRSFASPNIEEENARRTSLARALEIRKLLAENNINQDRINIRALGDNTDKLPTDRADLILLP